MRQDTIYRNAFANRQQPFLFDYRPTADKRLARTVYTRGQIWDLALCAAAVLRQHGLTKGDTHLHCFGANRMEDLIFRLATTMTGTVPVTVNWEADTPGRVAYKQRLTNCKLVLSDDLFSPEHLAECDPTIPNYNVQNLHDMTPTEAEPIPLGEDDARIVIFTSGTTGQPKGALHHYRSYQTNQNTFNDFLEPGRPFALVAANALHHANATATCDWVMREPNAELHLIERYCTDYWRVLTDISQRPLQTIVAPVVARHFDFLAALETGNRLPVPLPELQEALAKITLLIGSAPVGPTTVQRIKHFAQKLPTVRFGSTETCLQVMGIAPTLEHDTVMRAFERGWAHEGGAGYYIGRPHAPHTRVQIVAGIDPDKPGYMEPRKPGVPGYVITQGGNLMHAYVQQPEATAAVMHQGWYTGLMDIGFWLESEGGEQDFYWMSRESTLLIRGGSNYAYDQINNELTGWLIEHAGLQEVSFELAVVGLKLDSEHEDACCVTLSLPEEIDAARRENIRGLLLEGKGISKGARPNQVRFGPVPRNFKGAVLVPQLKEAFTRELGRPLK